PGLAPPASLPDRRQLALERADVRLGARDVFLQALHAVEVLLVVALAAEPVGLAVVVLAAQRFEAVLCLRQFRLQDAATLAVARALGARVDAREVGRRGGRSRGTGRARLPAGGRRGLARRGRQLG